jgi:hypothetical protein
MKLREEDPPTHPATPTQGSSLSNHSLSAASSASSSSSEGVEDEAEEDDQMEEDEVESTDKVRAAFFICFQAYYYTVP